MSKSLITANVSNEVIKAVEEEQKRTCNTKSGTVEMLIRKGLEADRALPTDDPIFRLIVALSGNLTYDDPKVIVADAHAIFDRYMESEVSHG